MTPLPPARLSFEGARVGGDAACRGAAWAGESVTPRRLPVYLRGVALGLCASYCWKNRMSALRLSTKRTACVSARPSRGWAGGVVTPPLHTPLRGRAWNEPEQAATRLATAPHA